MSDARRSRPARQPNWRPGSQQEVHPWKRWLNRLGWTAVAGCLAGLFVWLLWPRPVTPTVFASIVVSDVDAGQLTTPAFANADAERMAQLPWTKKLISQDGTFNANDKREVGPAEGVLVCYIAGHIATRLVDGSPQLALLSTDYSQARLADFVDNAPHGPATPLRELLQSIATQSYATKIVLLDSPRASAEPWLAVAQADWAVALKSDVESVESDSLWVICAGPSNTQSRINHRLRGSVFMEQVGEVLREKHAANKNGRVDLQDLMTRLTQTLGASPVVVTRSQVDPAEISLPVEFTQAAAKVVEPVPEKKKEEEGAAEKPAEPVKPVEPKGDAVWLAHDYLLDVGQQLKASPLDYAPASWRELQEVLVWSDWRRHTGGEVGDGPLESSFLAVKDAIGQAAIGESNDKDFTEDALRAFPAAIRNFQRTRKELWSDAPKTYLTAVRRRNLLLSRLPDYWRWQAACGRFEAQQCDKDIIALKTLCDAIQDFEGQDDRSRAEDIPGQANVAEVDALLAKVTTDIQQEVSSLYTTHGSAAAAPLTAATQHRMEQLLLTPLPSAADRELLWKVLKEAEIAPSVGEENVAIAMPTSVAGDQAEMEARWARFTVSLIQDGNADDKLPALASQLTDSAAMATSLDECAKFVRLLSEYRTLLKSRIQSAPRSGSEELLARAGDAQLERDDSEGGMAPLKKWNRQITLKLKPESLDFSNDTVLQFTLDIVGASHSNTNSLRFVEIPPQLKLRHGDSDVRPEDVVLSKDQRVTLTATYLGEPPKSGLIRLVVIAQSKSAENPDRAVELSAETPIPVKLPAKSAFALVRLSENSLVREAREPSSASGDRWLTGVRLLAHPNDDSVYDIGLSRTAGPRADVKVELYALKDKWSRRSDVPLTVDALQRDAVKLGVSAVVEPSGESGALKFSLAGAAPDALMDAAATTPVPPPAAPKEVDLPSLQLVAVITETKAGGGVEHHLEWLGIEPLHPDQFVDAEAEQPREDDGIQLLPFKLSFAENTQSPTDLPRGAVFVKLGETNDLSPAVKGYDFSSTELPKDGLKPALRFDPTLAKDGEGLVFLDVANYPRSFIWQLPDNRDLSRRMPRVLVEERIHVRQPRASTSAESLPGQLEFVGRPTEPIVVQIEVDNVASEKTVEIGLRKTNGTVIDAHQVRGSRSYRPLLKVEEETGRLIIHCDVADFTFALQPGGTDGEAEIYATVLGEDHSDGPALSDIVRGVLDGTAPRLPNVDPDVPIRRTSLPDEPVIVEVSAEDTLSGPKLLEYWMPGSPKPVITEGAAEPKGQEIFAQLNSSSGDGYRFYDFQLQFNELKAGDAKVYLRVQDFAGNWSPLTSLTIRHKSAMAAAAEKTPQPRDVRLKVTYKRGSEKVPVRNPTATIMGPGDLPGASAKGDTQGVVVLKQLPPGPHKIIVAGRPRNAGEVKKEETVEVPDDGQKTPIEHEVSLD